MSRFSCARSSRGVASFAVAAIALACAISGAHAQTKGKVPPPKEVSFHTADGVEIAALYYAQERGKESMPVILLHELGGAGADFKGLAQFLQEEGFVVLVPDLRGHGGSTTVRGARDKLDHTKMPPKQLHNIYVQGGDIDACLDFLREENNLEKLNVDKLCIVGAGLGGILAMNWAIVDWGRPVFTGGRTLGRNVKGIAMLSPPFAEKSVNVNTALRAAPILKQLAIYIAAGESGKPLDDAKKIHKPIHLARDVKEGEEVEKGVLLQTFKTNRQGAQLLMASDLKMPERIVDFFKRTVGKRDLPWKERKDPVRD